ncbi:MAG: metallophosphoesterase [Methylocystis sp.]|nr:metallophosphoesterase [Methylocystis sp.]MBI3275137.1 metallophosphoesterase [Methylocystis sp.]
MSEVDANLAPFLSDDEIDERLQQRLGRLYARQRLGIERDHEAQVFGHGLNFFHIENLLYSGVAITALLKVCGLYRRGRRNAERVSVRANEIVSPRLPAAFDQFTILHLSDLHTEMSQAALERVVELVQALEFDVCVLTGDYRAKTHGPIRACLADLARVRASLREPVYGVLGNHDTIRMAPDLEQMGVRMLLNECVAIERGDDRIHLAGVDDAHFYRVDNIEKAAAHIPHEDFSILLSHTPEIYRQAAYAGFDLLLSGHTHGGQICLPGGLPITLDSELPRAFGAGAWTYGGMAGYTSAGAGSCIVPVRFNCPPEITLHRLRCAARVGQ